MVDEESPIDAVFFRSIDELDLSVRSLNALGNGNIAVIGELVQRTEQDLYKVKNFGRHSMRELKRVLTAMDLTLGMTIDGWAKAAYSRGAPVAFPAPLMRTIRESYCVALENAAKALAELLDEPLSSGNIDRALIAKARLDFVRDASKNSSD